MSGATGSVDKGLACYSSLGTMNLSPGPSKKLGAVVHCLSWGNRQVDLSGSMASQLSLPGTFQVPDSQKNKVKIGKMVQ